MAKNSDRLKHALRNHEVCHYLEKKPEFTDWIITTAFYTCLQFVCYKIFPFDVPAPQKKKTIIECIDHYKNYMAGSKNKHELLSELVYKYCPSISEDYDWLLSMSMTARYHNYMQSPQVSKKAISLMEKIKKYCE